MQGFPEIVLQILGEFRLSSESVASEPPFIKRLDYNSFSYSPTFFCFVYIEESREL